MIAEAIDAGHESRVVEGWTIATPANSPRLAHFCLRVFRLQPGQGDLEMAAEPVPRQAILGAEHGSCLSLASA